MWRLRLVSIALLVHPVLVIYLAIRFLPGWVCLVIAGGIVLIPVIIQLVVRWKVRSFIKEVDSERPDGMPQLFTALFKLKGSVLRKARMTVHSVRPVLAPPHLLDEVAPADEPQRHLPAPDDSADWRPEDAADWRPDETQPVDDKEENPPETKTGEAPPPRNYYLLDVTIKPTRWGIGFKRWQPGELTLTLPGSAWLDSDDSCQVQSVEVEQDGEFGPEDDMRYAGSQRLRLLVGVREGVERLVFQYYTEKFGEVVLPPHVIVG